MISLSEVSKKCPLTLEDLVRLEDFIIATGYMTHEKARSLIEWFTLDLGIDDYYFKTTSMDDIAKHLIAISASELVSEYGGEGVGIQLFNERPERAFYIVEEESSKTEEIEKRIEAKYPLCRLESYISKKTTHGHYLRLYTVTRPVFKKDIEKIGKPSFEDVVNRGFLENSDAERISRYREAWVAMTKRESPYIAVSDKDETGETRIMVGIHGEKSGRNFLTNFSHLFYQYKIHSNRKYIEPFFDNKQVITFYVDKLDRESVEELSRDLSTVVMLPQHPITQLFLDELYSSQQTMYMISAVAFTHQFISALTEEYLSLSKVLKDEPEAKGILDTIKMRLIKDTFSTWRISQTVIRNHEIVSEIFRHFEKKFHPARGSGRRGPRPGEEGAEKTARQLAALEESIVSRIEKDVPSQKDRAILKYFFIFNRAILKTNFFMWDKTCVAYRLDPGFLNEVDFPDEPFGVFFFAGREFIGFHVRFRDIARGGIRIVRSRDLTSYENNIDTIFLENYNLAATQQKKNKDIPEGGAKGTILLGLEYQDEGDRAFKNYIDGMLDLLMPNEEVLDLCCSKEILFLGPDEGTAGLMNWAALYAKRRGYPYWRAFTTGKEPALGGVPHDMFGMTTEGIHGYVLGVLEKLGMREEEITKIQTGGPDGDLGSNEILVSKDRTTAVVDGSGVLYDPQGINKEELKALAKKRVMCERFNRSLLSPGGFFVSVNDKEVKLPDGSLVKNGVEFRNSFHLHALAKADLFVPCGGRPAAVNINNWKMLLDENGKPKFRVIVEGANLFITEEARLRLEERGVVIIKDASANKGGVTSSSFEVFVSLALSEREHEEHMAVRSGKVSDFRRRYIDEILRIIRENARHEFDLLWREHEKKGIPFTQLTNLVSSKINTITDAVRGSELPRVPSIREKVITAYTPKPLLELVGLETILERVPQNYLEAVVATKIATDFVYSHGLDPNEVDFFNYINKTICG
jgi:glutamate dehydrogenase